MYYIVLGLLYLSACSCFNCRFGPPGRYCSENLSGYYTCFEGKSTYKKCQSGTRCSCYLDYKCPTNNTCEEFYKPLPMVGSFILDYKGYRTVQTPQGKIVERLRGTIQQNIKKKTFFQEDVVGSTRKFVLIVPNTKGKFNMYEGTFTKNCINSSLNKFSAFLDELNHFTRIRSKKISNYITEETWYFRKGRRHLGESLTSWEWIVKSNMKTKTLEPILFQKHFYGSALMKQNEVVSWTSITVVSKSPSDQVFRVPSICK